MPKNNHKKKKPKKKKKNAFSRLLLLLNNFAKKKNNSCFLGVVVLLKLKIGNKTSYKNGVEKVSRLDKKLLFIVTYSCRIIVLLWLLFS